MREKNGFIATSVLYAFLIAFLTLFLGFMSSYVQNLQLVRRIEEMAAEDLKRYNETRISDLKVGDYVVIDTIDNEGGLSGDTVAYIAPFNPSTRWILFDIDEGSGEGSTSGITYSFVSDADALKNQYINGGFYDFNGTPMEHDLGTGELRYPTLRNLSILMHGNVYYNNAAKIFKSYGSDFDKLVDGNYRNFFSYQFMYALNGGIRVRFMTDDDFEDINNLENNKIRESVFNQDSKYSIWDANFDNVGFYNINKAIKDSYYNLDDVNRTCRNSRVCYAHDSIGAGDSFDYIYYEDNYIGNCDVTSAGGCSNIASSYNPRFVATITIKDVDDMTNGYFDSGNGTKSIPYLLTRGAKK